ncbi:MAG: pilus assembly protein PilO [Cyanobacteria bacterium P01_E01_bin.42]
MTFADDLAPMEGEEEERSPYPAAFGITFTPTIIGILAAIVGLGVAVGIGFQFLRPAWENLQTVRQQVDEKEVQKLQLANLEQRSQELQGQLQQIQISQRDVLSLFSEDNSLDTLLLNLNQQVKNRGVLLNYTPPAGEPELITDGSWGEPVNNLLKRQQVGLQIEAPFGETLEILRNLERLQTLVAVKNLRLEVTQQEARLLSARGNVLTAGEPELTSNFDLEILIPVSEEELAAQSAPPPAEGADPGTPPPQ